MFNRVKHDRSSRYFDNVDSVISNDSKLAIIVNCEFLNSTIFPSSSNSETIKKQKKIINVYCGCPGKAINWHFLTFVGLLIC